MIEKSLEFKISCLQSWELQGLILASLNESTKIAYQYEKGCFSGISKEIIECCDRLSSDDLISLLQHFETGNPLFDK